MLVAEGRASGKRKPPTYLTTKERDRLLAQPTDPRDGAILTLFCYAGLRLNELVMLDIDDVDFDAGWLLVRHAKGGKWRRLGLHPKAAAALRAYLATRRDGSRALFVSRQGSTRLDKQRLGERRRVDHRTIQVMLDRYAEPLELGKRVTPHCLRHTFATTLFRQTGDLQLVQRALGHSRIETTTIYLHLEDETVRNAMAALA